MSKQSHVWRTVAILSIVMSSAPQSLRAQSTHSRPISVAGEVTAGSELERYMRLMSLSDSTEQVPWSVRAFSPRQLRDVWTGLAEHPWRARYSIGDGSRSAVEVIRPTAALRYNTTYPFGGNDGPTWAGRGATMTVEAGVTARFGPLSLVLRPTAFWAQNQEIALATNGLGGDARFGDLQFPTVIDLPRRFGDAPYARIDWGESVLRLDLGKATVGASTASEWWGPADRYPFLLSNNAGGFPHLFAGTTKPVDLWIARFHAHAIWGRLDQSDYFTPSGLARPRRFASGLIALVQPRGLPGLEIGGARFFHAPWPDSGLSSRYFTRPIEGLLKTQLAQSDASIPTDDRSIDGENQIASIFMRWAFPRSGFEVYGEYGRDDHNWDGRDLLLEPDHQASLLLGLRKQWHRADGSVVVVRGERMDFTANTLAARRGGGSIYLHSSGANQGHTQRGQLLGADIGVGSGSGTMAAVDWYRSDGRWTVDFARRQRQEHRATVGQLDDPASLNVEYALGAERLLFIGGADLTVDITVTRDFNRDFGRDRSNVSIGLSSTGIPRW